MFTINVAVLIVLFFCVRVIFLSRIVGARVGAGGSFEKLSKPEMT